MCCSHDCCGEREERGLVSRGRPSTGYPVACGPDTGDQGRPDGHLKRRFGRDFNCGRKSWQRRSSAGVAEGGLRFGCRAGLIRSASTRLPDWKSRLSGEVAGSGTVATAPGDSAALNRAGETAFARNPEDPTAAVPFALSPVDLIPVGRPRAVRRAKAGEHHLECAGNFRSWPESSRSNSATHRKPV